MHRFIAPSVGLITVLLLAGCATTSSENTAESITPSAESSQVATPGSVAEASTTAAPEVSASPKAPIVDTGIATADATAEQLIYLIEEEKLAHDVYQAMFDLWGSKVFGNILKSELSHQSQVLVVMTTRDIADPRLSTAGKFVNVELQDLYDQLIAKGKLSAKDAYEVGVAIEELDIDDITKMLATAKDVDVIAMMENLRKGSENHLRAFNNQL